MLVEKLNKRRRDQYEEGHGRPQPSPSAQQLVSGLSVTHSEDYGGTMLKLLRFGEETSMDSQHEEGFVVPSDEQWLGLVAVVEELQNRADGW